MFSQQVSQSDDDKRRSSWIANLYRHELGHEKVAFFPQTTPFAIEGRLPLVVIFPETPEQVAEILEIAQMHKITIAPWGGGTQAALGYSPEPIDAVISMERISNIISFNDSEKTITVGSGATIKKINFQLASQRYFIPIDGPFPYKATIGGRISAGINGLRRSMYGNLHEMILSLQFAGVTGKLSYTSGAYSTSFDKYDLNKVFVGTLGSLGIITEVTVPLQPIPQMERVVIASFEFAEQAWEWLEDFDPYGFELCSIVMCSPGTLAVGSGLGEAHFRQLKADKNIAIVGRFAGTVSHVQRKILTFHAISQKYDAQNIILLGGVEIPALWRILDDFPATLHLQPIEAVFQVNMILPTDINALITHTARFASEHSIAIHWQADVLAHTVTFRVQNAHNLIESGFAYLLQILYVSITRRWINTTLLGCVPSMKSHLAIWGTSPMSIEIARTMKRTFDPANILNPGRIRQNLLS